MKKNHGQKVALLKWILLFLVFNCLCSSVIVNCQEIALFIKMAFVLLPIYGVVRTKKNWLGLREIWQKGKRLFCKVKVNKPTAGTFFALGFAVVNNYDGLMYVLNITFFSVLWGGTVIVILWELSNVALRTKTSFISAVKLAF